MRYRVRMTEAEALERTRVGARIRQLRQERNVTASQLGAVIGCSDSHLYNIEAGRSNATDELREAIAQALGFTLGDLEVAS